LTPLTTKSNRIDGKSAPVASIAQSAGVPLTA